VSTSDDGRRARLLALYEEGRSNREIGVQLGLSAERIRQLLLSYGIDSRPADKRRYEAAVRGRKNEIIATYRRLGSESQAARELGLQEYHVRRLIRASVPEAQVLRRRERSRRKRYTDEDLCAALREAAKQLPAPLGYHAYRKWAEYRRADGLPSPSAQTVVLRLGTWREALDTASLPVLAGGGRSPTYGRSDGVRALAQAWRELGQAPSIKGYETWRAGRRDLPSPVTVRRLAASWSDLLREAHGLVHGAHKGPMAASGERQ
jgi:DNA-binding CsgD family transcriptional regulator